MSLGMIYNHIIIPIARKMTEPEMGVTHLQQIGPGFVLSLGAMAMVALVEGKRKWATGWCKVSGSW